MVPGRRFHPPQVLGTLPQGGCHGCDGVQHLGRDLVPPLGLNVAVSINRITQVITSQSDQGEVRFKAQGFRQTSMPKTMYKITVSWQPEFFKSVLQPFVQLILAEW